MYPQRLRTSVLDPSALCWPEHGQHGAARFSVLPSLSLAKSFNHILKVNPYGLFSYVANDSFLGLNTKGKIMVTAPILATLENRSNQDSPTHPNTDLPHFLLKQANKHTTANHLLSAFVPVRCNLSPLPLSSLQALLLPHCVLSSSLE